MGKSKVFLALAGLLVIVAVIFFKDFASKTPGDSLPDAPASTESKPPMTESTEVGTSSSNLPERNDSSTPSDVTSDIKVQKPSDNTADVLPEGAKTAENLSTDRPADSQVGPQGSTTARPTQRSFKGIKQSYNDIMVSEIKYTPGDLEDGFVATFQSDGAAKGFEGNVWIIGDYVQRGTTGIMAIPSHSELKLSADGSPSNPQGGPRLTVRGGRVESASRKFSIKRPGFDGEELSQIRVGIYDRSTGKLHVARVSAAELAKKRSTKRVRVDDAN